MTFDPRGPFRADAPILDLALTAAAAVLSKLPKVAPGGLSRLYLHQTAEEYGCVSGAYHAVVAKPADGWQIVLSHDVRDNAFATFSPENYAEHTYRRNTGAIGLALDGLIGAGVSPNDFGSEPIQMHEVEFLCAAAAAFCTAYEIDALGTSNDAFRPYYNGEPNILTHAEAANRVGNPPQYAAYGPQPGTCERWDLATLIPAPAGYVVTDADASVAGDELRRRIHVYKTHLLEVRHE